MGDTGAGDPGGVVGARLDELVAAGLYDPASPHAAGRLRLLEWLLHRGFSIEQMRVANATGDLPALAGDAQRRLGVVLTIGDVAARSGLTVEQLVEIRRATGLAPVPLDVPVHTEADLEAFEVLRRGAELFSWSELMHLVRVIGSSMARVADAGNALFRGDVELPLRASGAAELEIAERSVHATALAGELQRVFATLFRLHLDQEISRSRDAYGRMEGPNPLVPMAVGFVDLVGFTQRAATMDAGELAELIAHFESTAHDTVTDLGGRLVKLIGDEVMFVAVEASTACDIAVALLRVFGGEAALTPRGGLAHGDVLARGGDYFGPIVNLAARLAEQAVPGEVLATPEVVAAAGRPVRTAGRRMLKGFVDAVEVVSLSAE